MAATISINLVDIFRFFTLEIFEHFSWTVIGRYDSISFGMTPGCLPEDHNSPSATAIFSGPGATYQADSCDPLRAAIRRGEVKMAALVHPGYPGRVMPAGMLREVCTVGFWDATDTQTWGLDWHRNEGLELTYLARGRTEFLVDEESFMLENGDLTITRPWQRHRVGNPHIGPSRLCWLILDMDVRRPDQPWQWPDWMILSPPDLRRLTMLLSQNEQPVWRANDEIAACFERLAALVQTPAPLKAQTRLQLHINELLIALRELLEGQQVKLDSRLVSTRRAVKLFLSTLPENLHEPWTLDQMAYKCGLGVNAFANYCRQITNLTPAKYLVHCRVQAAKRILVEHPSMSITDVALGCGFQNSQYFATAFRHKTGMTPRAWREKTSQARPSAGEAA
jgi:AraC family L-rhamnose operon regulatory protein RhaS